MPSSIVIIAAPDLLPSLESRIAAGDDELLSFADVDALRALQAILQKRPRLIALDQQFATTPRGAALMTRIKADPGLIASELRIVSRDGEASPKTVAPAAPPVAVSAGVSGAAAAVATVPLDTRGTRRAQRIGIVEGLEAVVDGNVVSLVDISAVGAQVLSAAVVKPNQRVRMALTDEQGVIRLNATVAWAQFEIPPQIGPRYRAGLEFIDADGALVEAYALRHRAN